MNDIPEEIPENGLEPEVRRAYNRLVRFVRRMIPRDSASVSVTHSAGGVHLAVKENARGNGNGSIPRWG